MGLPLRRALSLRKIQPTRITATTRKLEQSRHLPEEVTVTLVSLTTTKSCRLRHRPTLPKMQRQGREGGKLTMRHLLLDFQLLRLPHLRKPLRLPPVRLPLKRRAQFAKLLRWIGILIGFREDPQVRRLHRQFLQNGALARILPVLSRFSQRLALVPLVDV